MKRTSTRALATGQERLAAMKKYGIKITLSDENPMRAEHLIGPDWQGFRWYNSEAERDASYEDVIRQLPNYRKGDRPAEVVTKVERD